MFQSLHIIFQTILLSISICVSTPCHASNIDPAPSADLFYKIKSSQKGIPVNGEAKIQWRVSDGAAGKKTYSLNSETTVTLFGKILLSSSKGKVDETGLVPDEFLEKRFRRTETQTSFDWTNKRVSFSSGEPSLALKGREQDRLSITWQIVALARQAGARLIPGQEWKTVVAGTHDADPWSFKVQEKLSLRTELGDIEVIHVLRAPPTDAPGQHLELWLAPSLEFYPMRIRFSDDNGDRIEQTISRIQKFTPN